MAFGARQCLAELGKQGRVSQLEQKEAKREGQKAMVLEQDGAAGAWGLETMMVGSPAGS
jgi:hypothetical protein